MKRKTAYLGLFAAVAIIFGYVESLVPVFTGIPGIKLGLANLAVLFILDRYSLKEAALVSVVRILVIGFMFGNLFSILYSLAGAALSLTVMELLKKHSKAIVLGLISGVITSLVCVLVLALLFHFDHAQYVTLLPKSITTAIGMGISEELGGYVTITVAVIIITGVIGNMLAETVCRIFKIEEPVAKGIAIGASSHAVGTVKAMEIGEIEGAMISLAIAVAGLLTVVLAPVFAGIM